MVGGADDESFVEGLDNAADGLLVLLWEALEEGVGSEPGWERGGGGLVGGWLEHGEGLLERGSAGFSCYYVQVYSYFKGRIVQLGDFWGN